MPAKKGVKNRTIVNGVAAVYKSKIHSEATIQRILSRYFKEKKMRYIMSNIYFFQNWESDFFMVSKTKKLFEIEIKRDREDFLREFKHKPVKHKLLREAFEEGNEKGFNLPHKFYFCAPQGMIDIDEIPEYAGLIEIVGDSGVKYTKQAPDVHNNIKDVDSIMLKKFYSKSLKLEDLLIKFRIDLFKNPTDKEGILQRFLKTLRF